MKTSLSEQFYERVTKQPIRKCSGKKNKDGEREEVRFTCHIIRI